MSRPSPEVLRVRFRQLWEGVAARVRAPVYLVGSYLRDSEEANDIDIVAALPDDSEPRWFDLMRAQAKLSGQLSKQSGLPIDFKLQNGIQFKGQAAEAPIPPLLLAEPGKAVVPEEDSNERILCSAVYVDTGKAEPARRSYSYPATGLLFGAWRHSDCFTAMTAWAEKLTEGEKAEIDAVQPYQLAGRRQGFITSRGRYVEREEAWHIAKAAGQLEWLRDTRPGRAELFETDLHSEDLY
jgi:hypothetical protein